MVQFIPPQQCRCRVFDCGSLWWTTMMVSQSLFLGSAQFIVNVEAQSSETALPFLGLSNGM